MDRRIRTLGELSFLDVAGRVIQFSRDGGQTWTFARLTGQSENAVDTQASGMGIVVVLERSQPAHRTILTEKDFYNGLIVLQSVADDAANRKWWD